MLLQIAPPAQTAYGVTGGPFPVGYPLAAQPARKVSFGQIFKPTIAPGYTGAPISGGLFVPQQGAGTYFAPQPQAPQQQPLALQPTPLVPFFGPASQPAFAQPPRISGVNSNPQGLQFNHQRAKSSPFPGAQILSSNPRLEQPAPAAIALSPQSGSAAAAANVTPATTNANAEQQSSMSLTPAPNSVATLRAKYLGWNVVECLYGAECTLPVVYKMLPQRKVSDREYELIPDAHFDFFEKGYMLTIYTRTRNPRFEAARQVGAPAPQEPELLVQKSIEPFVDEDRILYTVRPEAPHDRVVGLIQFGLRQDSKRKVHLLLYLCETPDVAAELFDQFRRLGDGPEKLVNIKNLEGQLVDEGQLSTHSKELLRAVAAPCEPSDNRQRDKQVHIRIFSHLFLLTKPHCRKGVDMDTVYTSSNSFMLFPIVHNEELCIIYKLR